jgi:Zn-dependent M28 family amino/carboxypeptidase
VDRADSLVRLDLTYEQYGQIWRNLRRGVPVAVEAEVRNRVLTDDPSSYNVFADLRGADKAGDYVMIGAHLDSWHVGTGATDNAAGVVVMMEALRILRALDLRPRRTIRLALWDPEERGPWGSQQWLSAHPELHARISAYLNVDVGSGRLRAVRLESNPQAASMFEQILAPFRDLGIVGTVPERAFGTTDHESFNRVGIPGFAFAQDPLDYWQRTHHTSADTYERLNIDDLKQAAIVIAGTAWAIANREEPVPRGAAAAR